MSKSATSSERVVEFGYVDESRLHEVITRQQDDNFGLNSIVGGVPAFTKVGDYTTFLAEYALQDGNIIVHFFPPEEIPDGAHAPSSLRRHMDYWKAIFPAALDNVAQEVFQATAPRLQAKYTEEMSSWWFRALGYDHIIDLKGFLTRFFDELDSALERA